MRQVYESFDVARSSWKALFQVNLRGYVFLACVVAVSGGILFGERADSVEVMLTFSCS